MAYLIKTTEVYRVKTEEQAKNFIEEQKQNDTYEITKYATERKDRKVKGEIVESYYQTTITKVFNDIKDPVDKVTVKYE